MPEIGITVWGDSKKYEQSHARGAPEAAERRKKGITMTGNLVIGEQTGRKKLRAWDLSNSQRGDDQKITGGRSGK